MSRLLVDAIKYLAKALDHKESYRDEILKDDAIRPLSDYSGFQDLVGQDNSDIPGSFKPGN